MFPLISEPAQHTNTERSVENHCRTQVRVLGSGTEADLGHGRRHHVRHGAEAEPGLDFSLVARILSFDRQSGGVRRQVCPDKKFLGGDHHGAQTKI